MSTVDGPEAPTRRPEPSTWGVGALLAVCDHLELVARLVRGQAAAQGGGEGGELGELLAALSRSSAALGEPPPGSDEWQRQGAEATEEKAWQWHSATPSGVSEADFAVPSSAAQHGGEVEGQTAGFGEGVFGERPRMQSPEVPKGKRSSRASSGSLVSFFGEENSKRMTKTITYRNPALRTIERKVKSYWMECVSACLIATNTMFMVLEGQFVGAKVGNEIGFYSYYGSDKFFDSPGALTPDVFFIIDVVFCVLFTIELLLRLVFLRVDFLCDPWGWLDMVIVLTTDITTFFFQGGKGGDGLPISTIRILRLARLLRIMKLVRSIKLFDSLYLMTTALRGSMSALVWVIAFLFLIQTLFALLLTNIVQDFYLGQSSNGDEFFESSLEKEEIFKYFGTYWRAMVSLFELMLANWPVICRLMMETMDEVWSVFVILYKLLMGVAVIGVIMGVFTQETFRAADSDDQLMIRNKDKQDKKHLAKMKALFEKMTKNSECATVDSALFEKILKSPEMRLWLKAMDYDISDASLLFYLIDSNDNGKLTIEEFSQGMASLKGGARNVDVKLLLRQSRVGRMVQSSRNAGGAKMSRMSTVEALRRFEMP